MVYGYWYNIGSLQKTGGVGGKKNGFSMLGLLKEAVIGGVMGGLAGTAFNGAGKAFGFLKDSVRDVRGKRNADIRNRIGKPVIPMEKTIDMALGPETYAYAIADKYGINLKGSGQKISIKYNPNMRTGTYGLTSKANPNIIEIGPNALISEAELANTIAHELNHARDFLRGGPAEEKFAYKSGNALADYIFGGR